MVIFDESTSFKFLSTPSARRATMVIFDESTSFKFLSTPSARRATLVVMRGVLHR